MPDSFFFHILMPNNDLFSILGPHYFWAEGPVFFRHFWFVFGPEFFFRFVPPYFDGPENSFFFEKWCYPYTAVPGTIPALPQRIAPKNPKSLGGIIPRRGTSIWYTTSVAVLFIQSCLTATARTVTKLGVDTVTGPSYLCVPFPGPVYVTFGSEGITVGGGTASLLTSAP